MPQRAISRKIWYAAVVCIVLALLAAARVFRAGPDDRTLSVVEAVLTFLPGIIIPGLLYLYATHTRGVVLTIWLGFLAGVSALVFCLGLWLQDGFFCTVFILEIPLLALLTCAILFGETAPES